MKIAIIGTHGTGKTTLAYEITAALKKQGINATMCTEVARRCPLPINRKGNFQSQLWIFATQIKEEIEAQDDYEFVVCDRSVLDTLIYTYFISGNNAEKLRELAVNHLASYDILFKMPIVEGYITKDGVRDTDLDFQKEIDVKMDAFLKNNNIPFVELPKINPALFILEKINLSRQQKLSEF